MNIEQKIKVFLVLILSLVITSCGVASQSLNPTFTPTPAFTQTSTSGFTPTTHPTDTPTFTPTPSPTLAPTITSTLMSFTPQEMISVPNADRLRLWRIVTMPEGIANFRFSPDGKWIAVITYNKLDPAGLNDIHILDFQTGKEKEVHKMQTGNSEIFFISNFQQLISDRFVYDLMSGDIIHDFADDDGISIAALSPNGKYAASVDAQGNIDIWDVKAWKVVKHLETGKFYFADTAPNELMFSDDGSLLFVEVITGESVFWTLDSPPAFKIWNVNTGKEVYEGEDQVLPLFFEPDNNVLWFKTPIDCCSSADISAVKLDSHRELVPHGFYASLSPQIHHPVTRQGKARLVYDPGEGQDDSITKIECLSLSSACPLPLFKEIAEPQLWSEHTAFSPNQMVLASITNEQLELWAVAPKALIVASTATLTVTPQPTESPSLTVAVLPTATVPTCPDAPPIKLSVGDIAMVSLDPALPVRLRDQPAISGKYLGQIYPGEFVTITNGFRCADGYTWWEVTTAKNLVGWAIEGDQESYWLVKKSRVTSTPTNEPSATSAFVGNQDDLVAYYPFDGDAADYSDFGNNGEVHNVTLTADRNGKPNSAYEFNGVDSYIYVNDSASLMLTKNLTIAAWIKTSKTVPFAGIIVKANPVEPRSGYGIWVTDQQKLRADVIWDHSASITAVIVSNNQITDGKWHFITVTYDGEMMNLYIDGILNGTKTYEQGANVSMAPLLIGWDQNTWLSTRHYEGDIDGVRLYNRALSTDEILQLMQKE